MPENTATAASYYFVVPCGAAKRNAPSAAKDLYLGSLFQHIYAAAELEAEATRRDLGANVTVLILSAEYGLVDPHQVIAPYDVKMGQKGSVTAEELAAQATVRGISYGDEVFAFLPNAYRERLAAALDGLDVQVQNTYEGVAGCGDQRGINASLARHAG